MAEKKEDHKVAKNGTVISVARAIAMGAIVVALVWFLKGTVPAAGLKEDTFMDLAVMVKEIIVLIIGGGLGAGIHQVWTKNK